MQHNDSFLKTYHAWLMLGIGLLASVFAGFQVKQDIEHDAARRFELTSAQVALRIQERLGSYALILQGAAGLFAGSNSVDRKEWQTYVEKLGAQERVPGVQGIGFSKIVPPDQLAAHVASIRAEGFPEYTVRPSGERAVYTSIIYLEPFEVRNLRAFGFDMFSEPVRRNAMERARDTGESALSGKVELVQETGKEIQAGTLMYVPVYRNGAPLDTVEQRRSALIGWTYSPYRMQDLMGGILANWTSNEGKVVELHIYDGPEAKADKLLFDSHPASAPHADSIFYQQRKVEFHGNQWLLVFDAIEGTVTISYAGAWATLIGGFALSGLLCGLMLSLINTRIRAKVIANSLTEEIRRRESSLKDSEAFGRAILDSVSTEIAVLDRSGVIVAVNDPWRRFALENSAEAGKPSPQAEVGANYFAVCDTGTGRPSDDADASKAGKGIRAVLDGSVLGFAMEYPCHSPDQQRWFSMSVTPLRTNNGGVVVAHGDITKRKQIEEALRESEERWKFAIDGSGDGLWDWNVAQSTVYFSPRWKEMLGFTQDEIGSGLDEWSKRVHPDDMAQAMADVQAHFDGKTTVYINEHRVSCKDGSLKWILDRGLVVERDTANKPLRMIGTHTDITERAQAEAALQESENRFRNLFKDIPAVAVQGYGEDGTARYWNEASERLYGYRADEAIGRNMLDLIIPAEMRDGVREAMRGMFETATPIPAGELSLLRKDGSRVDVFSSHAYVHVPGRAPEMFCVDIDITERKQTEAELQQHRHHLEELVLSRTAELSQARDAAEAANRAKSMFLASMSHELRTPMNGIMGMTDLVLRRATDPEQIDWLNKSQGAAKHLLSVINDILDISKIESDRLMLEEQDFSLAEALDDAMHMQDAPAQAKGLSLSWHIDPALPDQLCGDAMRLRQILINFTGNAIKFSERGQITVRASAAAEDSQSVLLKIEVTDQGVGISPEQQARLFHAFAQADGSMTRKYGGTGLGLIISKRIALLMGGDAGVISEEGRGSTFWVTLRLRRATSDPQAAKSPPTESPRETLARLFPGARVLVAEDEPVNREVLVFLLEDVGLAPDVASNGQEAVEKASGGGYALILMDVQMPVMSGLEATGAIRELPGMANIPILALTANAFDEDRDVCLAAGMDDHIGKPVDTDALCAIVLHWLQKSAAVARV
jgi:PAS domain S-box-containing protein